MANNKLYIYNIDSGDIEISSWAEFGIEKLQLNIKDKMHTISIKGFMDVAYTNAHIYILLKYAIYKCIERTRMQEMF